MSDMLETIKNQVIAGKIPEVKQLVQEALSDGIDAAQVLEKGLLSGMDVVGKRMKTGEMFIPEVLRSAKSMQGGLALCVPMISGDASAHVGTAIIGTVQGDLHDIGKNLVSIMLSGAGFKVIDLGIDVKPEAFVAAVKSHQPQIVALSALLTTTMPKMAETVEALKQGGVRDQVKILVGGAPVSRGFAEEIGADGYGLNGAEAVDQARALLA